MRNDVTNALKEVAEKVTGKPVRFVLQRGSDRKRMFLVQFADGTHERIFLAKRPKTKTPAPPPPGGQTTEELSGTVNSASPDSIKKEGSAE